MVSIFDYPQKTSVTLTLLAFSCGRGRFMKWPQGSPTKDLSTQTAYLTFRIYKQLTFLGFRGILVVQLPVLLQVTPHPICAPVSKPNYVYQLTKLQLGGSISLGYSLCHTWDLFMSLQEKKHSNIILDLSFSPTPSSC